MISPLQRQPDNSGEKRLVDSWAKRRPAWTRTDTVRWLNGRSSGVLAWLRRVDPTGAPAHSSSMGRWLKDARPDFFTRAHERLAGLGRDDTAREKLNVLGVLQ